MIVGLKIRGELWLEIKIFLMGFKVTGLNEFFKGMSINKLKRFNR